MLKVINEGTVRDPKNIKKNGQFEYLFIFTGNEEDFVLSFQNRHSQNCVA
jgi:hypothetical protein